MGDGGQTDDVTYKTYRIASDLLPAGLNPQRELVIEQMISL